MEAIQWTIEIVLCAVIGLQLLSKDMRGQALNQMLFDCHPIHVGPFTQYTIINQRLSDFEVAWSPNFVLDPPL